LLQVVVAFSKQALELIGIAAPEDSASEQDLAMALSGNTNLIGSESYAHCYCGHQFGSFAGQVNPVEFTFVNQ
jgi:serine/tyrosine/threonine adenylyltransferase